MEDAATAGIGGTVDLVWDALASVPDPEVPAISIVELGIVRGVSFVDGRLRVEVTPTYSGCPATELIATSIRERLAAIGLPDVELVTRLSPPWTTEWMSPEGRRKLAQFGIAPPHAVVKFAGVRTEGPPRGANCAPSGGSEAAPAASVGAVISRLRKSAVACPRCGSTATSLLSQFGSTACKAQYRCDDCREPFDYFKPH